MYLTTLFSRTFDYEVRADRMHSLRVCVRDNGAPILTTCRFMIILVLDVNDNPPIFVPSNDYSIEVYENTPIDNVLLRVVTTDRDTPPNSVVEYSIVFDTVNPLEDDGRAFIIQPFTGAIKSINPLDRETRDFFSFTIRARNGEFTPEATINITILDRNDNTPVVSQPSLFADVPENSTDHTLVGTIVVEDADIGVNRNVTFRFTGGDDGDLGAFAINEAGNVYVLDSSQLDYETKDLYLINVSRNSFKL